MALNVTRSPVAVNAQYGIKTAGEELDKVSYKFATGEKYSKPSENLFATVESSMGKARLTYTESALANLTRLRSILATRNGALQTMISGVQKLSDIALQAAGTLPAEVRTANIGVFNQVMARVQNLAQTADYAGIKLLNGTFGSAGAFTETNPNIHGVTATVTGAALGGTFIGTELSQRTGTLTFANNANAADTITIGGVQFTYVAANADATQNQILLGATPVDTAKNTLNALNKSKEDGVKKFGYSLAGNAITITQLGQASTAMDNTIFSSSSDAAGRVTQAYLAAPATALLIAAQLTGPSPLGAMGPIALVESTLDGVARDTWANLSAALDATPVDPAVPAAGGPPAHTGDMLNKFSFKIGEEDYFGYTYNEDNGNAQGNRLICVRQSDAGLPNLNGKLFGIRLTAVGIAMKTLDQTSAFIADFNADGGTRITFKQTNYMKVDTSAGDIRVGNIAVGTVDGLTAMLKSTKFTGLQVSTVKCDQTGIAVTMKDAAGASKTFTAAYQSTYAGGAQITLTEAATGDTLVLTLGTSQTLDLTTEDNQAAVAEAFKNALGSSEASTFIVGTDASQKLAVQLEDMSWAVLTEGATLKIDTQADAQTATTKLNAIINALNAEVGTTAAYDSAVDSLVEQMSVSQQNLASAIESLTSIDIADTRQQLDVALRVYNSCIASMAADQRANQLLERLLDVR